MLGAAERGALARALREAVTDGAGYLPAAVPPDLRDPILKLVASRPFTAMEEEIGSVRQQVEGIEIRGRDFARFAPVDLLRRTVAEAVHDAGRAIRGLATWRPNEADIQRYRPGWLGITPHLDGKKYRRLVAVVTLAGSAPFSIHETREGPAVRTFDASPGSLIVMRAPGLAWHSDGRPFHSVGSPAGGERVSIGFRMRVTP